MMLNRIVIMGRLGRDPEVRYTQAGKPVASFSLAVDRDFKDKASGERATDWIPVVAWEDRISTRASWPWWRGASRSGTGPTRMAASAAAPR